MNTNNCLKGISKLSRCEILAFINSVSMILSDGLDTEDLSMLGTLFNAVGDTISAFSAIQADE